MTAQKVIVLAGETGEGKSSWLRSAAERLKSEDISVGGFIAPRVPCYVRSYALLNLETGRSIPLSSEAAPRDWIREGKFWFNPDALDEGNHILHDTGNDRFDLVCIDEIGPFELSGRVWCEGLTSLLEKRQSPVLLVVRQSVLEKVLSEWEIKGPEIISMDKQDIKTFSKLLKTA